MLTRPGSRETFPRFSGTLPPVGNTVNVADATRTNAIGDPAKA